MDTNILSLDEIKDRINIKFLLEEISNGFIAYSNKRTKIPLPGHLPFHSPPGDVHIKFGYILDEEMYVVKVASSFYENPKINLSTSNGLMLIFSSSTGAPRAVLLDEGYLTDLRTALASVLILKLFEVSPDKKIGIVGTGVQSHFHLNFINQQLGINDFNIWGRNPKKVTELIKEFKSDGVQLKPHESLQELSNNSDVIITLTSSTRPLITDEMVTNSKLIIAVGADNIGKQELEPKLIRRTDLLIADSISQCTSFGELNYSYKAGYIKKENIFELGALLQNKSKFELNKLVIADLTGLAVQDIKICQHIVDNT